MDKILTVCIGNICRSPTAEAVLRQLLPRTRVWSAGLAALVGQEADPLAQAVAREHQLNLSAHRAQQLAGWMCTDADLILVMENSQRQEIERLYPYARGKVHCLGIAKAGQPPVDIADPYRQGLDAFQTAYQHIELGARQWAHRIERLS
ncbi:low molecular weight phosphotyrosine protein phosphatase [Candidimonas humi]|uniref:protein-tyrosine-phosphatase n=1 Tax=Candidimonas humi TaxID=683355 RepID=A0ABV8NVL7_9BURK|nr:low molecular weight protein-tyrosine-phosphatase [Candidimonas humi]MBV6305089.1 low molecular weight phosphotyrosine protein phosphatase [Candidimonas humi]